MLSGISIVTFILLSWRTPDVSTESVHLREGYHGVASRTGENACPWSWRSGVGQPMGRLFPDSAAGHGPTSANVGGGPIAPWREADSLRCISASPGQSALRQIVRGNFRVAGVH